MKILMHPAQTEPQAKVLSQSAFPQATIIEWTEAISRNYEFGTIVSQHFIHKHFRFYLYHFIIRKPVTLYFGFEQPTIALQFMLRGSIRFSLRGKPSIAQEARQWNMNYLPQGNISATIDPGEVLSFHIEFEPPYLDELVEGHEDISRLRHYFDAISEEIASLPLAYIDQRVQDALSGIMNAHETPQELPIELKTHITMLLNLYRKSMKESETLGALPDVPYKPLLIELAKQIRSAPASKYNIHSLAHKHGIYYKNLAKAFKDLTGFTLKVYVHEQRMHHALQMVTGTQLPFHEIATELGYIEPNNLHRAFVKRFGKTLLEVRKNPGIVTYLMIEVAYCLRELMLI